MHGLPAFRITPLQFQFSSIPFTSCDFSCSQFSSQSLFTLLPLRSFCSFAFDPFVSSLYLIHRSFLHFELSTESMAKLNFMVALQTVFILGAVTMVTGGRPITTGALSQAAKMAAACTTGGLECSESTLQTMLKKPSDVHRDLSISTINDLQRDFFLESSLVVGGTMELDANLRDDAPKRAFLSAASAKQLPPLTSSNALNLVQHFGVAPTSEMASAIATAAYLCGYGALPGEQMSCADSTDAMASFVSTELGPKVKVLSTSNTPASEPAVKAPVTIVDFTKGSVAEGKTIVVCHAVKFSSALYYCHRVTGTKVVTATLKPAGSSDSEVIKGVGICHIDTSMWLSTHPAFTALHIPRGDEACHWLIDSDLVFVPTVTASELD